MKAPLTPIDELLGQTLRQQRSSLLEEARSFLSTADQALEIEDASLAWQMVSDARAVLTELLEKLSERSEDSNSSGGQP